MATTKALDIKTVEKVAKALGDKNRLMILLHITKQGGCAPCADMSDVVDLTQPSISHHIKILVNAGLIDAEKEGRNFKYTLNPSVLETFCVFLEKLKNH